MTKSVITELKAAAESHERVFHQAQTKWPTIYRGFREALGDGFQVADEQMASFDMALAATALNLQAVKNLFSAEQAKRLEAWAEKLINTPEWGEYALNEVRVYGQQFQEEMENVGKGGDPITAIPARLLHRWLGDGIKRFEIEHQGQKTGFISPMLVEMTVEALMPLTGTWKSIKDRYVLVEEDLPIETNWEAMGLYDLGRYPDDQKPDGTIIFYDKDGKTTEKWLHPAKFATILLSGGAKRVGTLCKVMVKGPWEGIKETRMQLSEESASAFSDGTNYVYALCVFKRGQPEYRLLKKEAWDNWH